MAALSKYIYTYNDGTYQIEDAVVEPSPTLVQWYQHREDAAVFGSVRGCAPCPAVMVMKDDQHAKMSQQWQYFLRAANYNMTLKDVFLLLDDGLAFANRTGFKTLDSPGKADYFFNRGLDLALPQLDKVRTTSRSLLTGTEQYSLAAAIGDVVALMRGVANRQVASFMHARYAFAEAVSTSANVLKVQVFDSRGLPPLKPGYKYPQDISEVDPNAYAIMPETHPEMFLVANIVNRRGEVVQFPRGALYPWFEQGKTTGSFVPHVANLAYGDILYPLRRLDKLPLGSPKPSPYRHD